MLIQASGSALRAELRFIFLHRKCKLTVTLHALVDEAVEQRATVVTEGGAPIGVDLELVLCSGILVDQRQQET